MQRPIMINGAMEDVEMNILKNELMGLKKVEDKVCTFYEGTINDYPIVLCVTGVGMLNTSVATTIGINRYNPKAIIVQGVAGSHSINIHKNDLVISTDIINMSSVKTPARKPGDGIDVLSWELLRYKHGDDKFLALKAGDDLIETAQKVSKCYTKGNVVFGRVSSGDVWNKEADRILMFNERYDSLCEEMEGYAVFHVAEKYGIPAIDIRVISNNEILGESYNRLLGHDSQEFTISLVKELIKN